MREREITNEGIDAVKPLHRFFHRIQWKCRAGKEKSGKTRDVILF